MFRVREGDTLTTCGLLIRKLKTHLHREGVSLRSCSLVTNLEGIMVLNAELKSLKTALAHNFPA